MGNMASAEMFIVIENIDIYGDFYAYKFQIYYIFDELNSKVADGYLNWQIGNGRCLEQWISSWLNCKLPNDFIATPGKIILVKI